MIDPIFPKPTEIKVETAALLTPATVLPSPTTDRPARDLVVSAAVEPTLSAPPSTHPNDTIGARPGDELENPHTVRNGEVKEALGNPFDDLYPEKPQRALSKISTASREGTRSSGADVPDAKGDTRDATSHTGLQDPKPAGGAPSGSSQGKKESKSDNGGHGSNGPASGGKGPKAGKDKPSAGKSAPAGLQDNHRSNGGKPSPRKADQNSRRATPTKRTRTSLERTRTSLERIRTTTQRAKAPTERGAGLQGARSWSGSYARTRILTPSSDGAQP